MSRLGKEDNGWERTGGNEPVGRRSSKKKKRQRADAHSKLHRVISTVIKRNNLSISNRGKERKNKKEKKNRSRYVPPTEGCPHRERSRALSGSRHVGALESNSQKEARIRGSHLRGKGRVRGGGEKATG